MTANGIEPAGLPPGRRVPWSLLASVLVVVAAGIGGLAVGHRFAAKAKPQESSTAAIVQFAVGQQAVYKLDYSSVAASNIGAIFSEANSASPTPSLLESGFVFQTNVVGELAVSVLEADSEHTLLAIEFRHPQTEFQSYGIEDETQSQRIQSGLSQPLFYALNARARCNRCGSTQGRLPSSSPWSVRCWPPCKLSSRIRRRRPSTPG